MGNSYRRLWPRIQRFCHQLQPTSAGVQRIEMSSVEALCRVVDADRWSVVLESLILHWHVPRQRIPRRDQFQQWVRDWCATVHYLQEPLRVVEMEPSEWTALVRSHPPSTWPDGTISYYDVWWYALRQPWETQIHRKRVQGDTPAQAVTMVWARDVLARFLMDAQNLWDRLWAGEE